MSEGKRKFGAVLRRRIAAAVLALGLGAMPMPAFAQPPLNIAPDGLYFQRADGRPFFYLGDTAWALFHRLTLEEADRYLRDRAEKGFTVVQAVALSELDGLKQPNANGDMALLREHFAVNTNGQLMALFTVQQLEEAVAAQTAAATQSSATGEAEAAPASE